MPIRLNLIERLAFYRLGAGPVPLLDVFGAFSFRVLVAGMRLGVFDSCVEPCHSAQLSTELEVDADSLAVLLRALEAIGYVEEKEEGWVNTATTNRWLVADHHSGVNAGVQYWARLLEGPLERLDLNLRAPPSQSQYDWLIISRRRTSFRIGWSKSLVWREPRSSGRYPKAQSAVVSST